MFNLHFRNHYQNTAMTNFQAKGLLTFIVLFTILFADAQTKKVKHKGEFYFSWGYNTEWYTRTNLKVSQPELGNNYTIVNANAHDHRGWDEGLFHEAISIPQYNYRFGYFFNNKRNLGVEINFDHTKYIITDGQMVEVKGTMNGKPVEFHTVFNEHNGFYYYLNNGANFLLFNIVKRWQWYANKTQKVKIDVLGKAGIGPLIPHVQNALFGKINEPGFQLGGWNTGLEGDIRATFLRHVYLEFAGKLDYARYSHLKVYKGTAHQAFGTAELVLNLGIVFGKGTRAKK
jgi:hypothetical protein